MASINKVWLVAFAASLAQVAASSYSILALGDWGGMGYKPYTTPGQTAAAAGMDNIAKKLNAKAVLALGDNFYSSGVTSSESDRFEQTFEHVYHYDSLSVPWYVTAGNHDYRGNVSAQIEYSNIAERWNFPSYYYDRIFEFQDENGDARRIHLIMIDTVILSGSVDVPEGHPRYFDPLPGPKDLKASEDEWTWIENTLSQSTADFIIVGGHYPVWSVCEHGPTSFLVDRLRPLLRQYGAHYMSGHDHCAMHIQEDDTHYILAGLGDTCCYKASKKDQIQGTLQYLTALGHNDAKAIGGFTSLTFTSSEMGVVYYDQDGNELFTTSIPARSMAREAN